MTPSQVAAKVRVHTMTTEQPTRPPFRGFQSPNYTMVPDELFDDLMVDLSGAELKVLLYIIRRTYGFKKDSDNISLSQMLHGIRARDGRYHDRGVGLSKKTLLGALRSLEDQHIILTERRQSAEKGNEPTAYRLNVLPAGSAGTNPIAAASTTQEETLPPLGEKLPQGGGGETPPSPRGKNSPTQETVEQQTDSSLSNFRMANAKSEHREETITDAAERREPTPPTAIGETLQQRGATIRQRRPAPSDPDRDVILDYMADLSRELGDRAPLKSSTTRAYNLYRQSGLPIDTFIEGLYRARATVKERSASIRGSAEAGTAAGRTLKIAYFFAVLEDLLGMREEPTDPPVNP